MEQNISASILEPSLSSAGTALNVGIKVAQMAKNQSELQGEMALKLIEAAVPDTPPEPVGNVGHNINTSA